MEKIQKKHSKQTSLFAFRFKKNLKAIWSLSKLINASYWQSKFGPVMTFLFGMAFIGVYGLISESQGEALGGDAYFKSAIIGVVAMQVMSFSINAVPQSINDYKTSVLLKRIGSTPIKPVTFLLTICFYYGVLLLISFFWNIMWLAIFFNGKINVIFNGDPTQNVQPVEWGGFIFSVFYTVITSLFLGLLVVSLTKNAMGSNVLGMIIFFLSMFLSGMLFPIQYITSSAGLNVISYFTPFRYTTGLITMSWNGANIFDMSKPYTMLGKEIYHTYDLWLNFFIPLVFIGLALFFSAKNFKWNVR